MPSIDAIEGMDHRHATTLRKARVRTTEALLKRASNPAGRSELAEATGLSEADLLSWAHRSDLLRIKGIGPEYALMLTKAGVETLKELRRRNPVNLARLLNDVGAKMPSVRRVPTEDVVASWILSAQTIEPFVER